MSQNENRTIQELAAEYAAVVERGEDADDALEALIAGAQRQRRINKRRRQGRRRGPSSAAARLVARIEPEPVVVAERPSTPPPEEEEPRSENGTDEGAEGADSAAGQQSPPDPAGSDAEGELAPVVGGDELPDEGGPVVAEPEPEPEAPVSALADYRSWDRAAAERSWARFAGYLSVGSGGFAARVATLARVVRDGQWGELTQANLQELHSSLRALSGVSRDLYVLESLRGTGEASLPTSGLISMLRAPEVSGTGGPIHVALGRLVGEPASRNARLLVRRRVLMLVRDTALYGVYVRGVTARGVTIDEERHLLAAYDAGVGLEADFPEVDAVPLVLTDPDVHYRFVEVVGHTVVDGGPAVLDIRWDEPWGVQRGQELTPSLLALTEVQLYLAENGLGPDGQVAHGITVAAAGA